MPALYLTLVFVAGWMALATWGPLRRVDAYPFPFLLFLNNVVQLVLCSVILVGQRVLGMAADRRAVQTYESAEAIFGQVADLQEHPARVQARQLGEMLASIGCLMAPASGPCPAFTFTDEE